jgi:hypothetical protein
LIGEPIASCYSTDLHAFAEAKDTAVSAISDGMLIKQERDIHSLVGLDPRTRLEASDHLLLALHWACIPYPAESDHPLQVKIQT